MSLAQFPVFAGELRGGSDQVQPMNSLVSEIPVLILAGGLGTRLRAAFNNGPKCMAPVGGRPFLEYLLSHIRRFGFSRVVLCVGYGQGQILESIGSGRLKGFEIRYSAETEPLGTGGALKRAESLIDKRDFLVFNGDSFLAIDLQQLVEEHLWSGAWATVALTKVHNSARFGSVVLAANGLIREFREKDPAVCGPNMINGGVYVLNRQVLDLIPESGAVSLEREIFPRLLTRGIQGFICDGYFIDIGIPEDFERAQVELPAHF